jgi:HD superfamily phosphohydrolase
MSRDLAMGAHESRLLVDVLYGLQTLDSFLADLIEQPEVQRLRDVRLSNINSSTLPGAANISRFEHSIGTALLAGRTAKALALDNADRHKLVLAALLHDVAITPYGHLMEEGFAYAEMPYDHEGRLLQILQGKAEHGTHDYQIFRGQSVGFRKVLSRRPYSALGIEPAAVMHIIQGKGRLGPLVNGSIDLDNIDNVCRMAYHLGIPYRRGLPEDLSRVFTARNKTFCLRGDKIDVINEWLHLRFRLYSVLMTNPTDFSAKAMLVEATRLGLRGAAGKDPVLSTSTWSLTDSDFMRLLGAYKPTAGLVRRLETGDLFAVVGINWINAGRFASVYPDIPTACRSLRREVAMKSQMSEEDVLFYGIRDKRVRTISRDQWAGINDSARLFEHGDGRQQVLLGCVAGKVSHVAKLRKVLIDEIESQFGAESYEPCDSDAVLQMVFNDITEPGSRGGLF